MTTHQIDEKIRDKLSALGEELEGVLGDRLVGVALFGDYARPESVLRESSLEVLVVLNNADSETLDRLAKPIRAAERTIGIQPMVVLEEDLRTSTDVFPIRFLEMRAHHVLIRGRDVLSELEIRDDHLRLRCEQELKNLLLRMRNVYLHRAQKVKLLRETLEQGFLVFLRSASALLLLTKGQAPALRADLVAELDAEFGNGDDSLMELLRYGASDVKPQPRQVRELFDRFLTIVKKAADQADRLAIEDQAV